MPRVRRPPPDRRHVLGLLGAGGLAVVATAIGCGADAPVDDRPRLALATLAPGARRRVVVRGVPVEVHRGADGAVAARTLRCTHMGCEVAWRPATSTYACPCHEGVYDADGRPVAGPPPRPLADVPVEVVGETVVVGAAAVPGTA